jgi:hypothetical protein
MITDEKIIALEKVFNNKLNNLLFGVKNLLENNNSSQNFEFTNLKIYYDELLKAKDDLSQYKSDEKTEIEN